MTSAKQKLLYSQILSQSASKEQLPITETQLQLALAKEKKHSNTRILNAALYCVIESPTPPSHAIISTVDQVSQCLKKKNHKPPIK